MTEAQLDIIWYQTPFASPSFSLNSQAIDVEIQDQGSQIVVEWYSMYYLARQQQIIHRSKFNSLRIRHGNKILLDI